MERLSDLDREAVELARYTAKAQAAFAGEWAGVADILARTLREHADTSHIDVACALQVYDNLNARYPRPTGIGA